MTTLKILFPMANVTGEQRETGRELIYYIALAPHSGDEG